MPAAPSRRKPPWARWWPVVLTLLAGTLLSLAAFIAMSGNQWLVQPWFVLTVGLTVTSLLTLYFSQLITRSLQVEAVVAERTAKLSEMNEELKRQIADRSRLAAESQQHAVLLSDSQRQLQEKAAALQRTVEELTRRERITQSLLDDLQQSRQQLEQQQRSLEAANLMLKKTNEELKAAQLQVIQAAKLESVGRLAAGVAHEVKNPLAIVLMGTAFLQKQLGQADAVVNGVIADMDKAVKRADGIIRGMLDFAAFKELRLTMEAINSVVEQSLALAKHELTKANVSVTRQLAENLPPVSIDRTKLEQVLVNLFVNASHAMAGGSGQLTVRTRLQKLTQPGSGIGSRTSDLFQVGETALVIEVDDTGKGIPPDLLSKVFDPFFTTKAPGQGTGLGLSVTRSIIELHRGIIELKNRPEGGCRATILLHT